MASLKIRRLGVLFGCGILIAGAVGVVANLLDLNQNATFLLAGGAVALVAGFGVPWVFGWPAAGIVFEYRHRVHPDESAVVASDVEDPKTYAGGIEFVLLERVQEDRICTTPPLVMPAGGAEWTRASFDENLKETLKVGHVFDPRS